MRAVTIPQAPALELHDRLKTAVQKRPARARSRFTLVFILYFALALILQMAAGVFHRELSGLPDEPAHYVTGLMVREYITTQFPHSPMRFAESYYLHYPKVAFGHWPPVFYCVEAFWMMIFPSSRVSVLVLMALLTATLAFAVAWYTRKLSGTRAGIAIGFLFVLLPLVQVQTGMVMVEVLLTLFSFLAAIAYGNYVQSERWQPAVWFGAFASLAILTKGDGWALALIPPVAIAVARKFYLIKRVSFWLPAAIVLLCCGPWQLFTLGMAKQGWVGERPNVQFTATALGLFFQVLWHAAGPAFFLFAAIGIVVKVLQPCWRGREVKGAHAALFALVVAVAAFHSIVPVSVEGRRMVMDLPGLVVFIPAGILWVAARFSRTRWRGATRPALLAGVAALLFFLFDFNVPVKPSFGFAAAARDLIRNAGSNESASVVSSEADGEGLFIAEVAMLQPRPSHFILRANKLLARVNWNGDQYQARFHTPGEVMAQLDAIPVDTVVIDRTAGPFHVEHHALLLKMIESNPQSWTLAGNYGGPDSPERPVFVYRRIHPVNRRPGDIRVDLTLTLNRILRQD